MLSEALSYPRRGDGWLKKIGIGGLLILFSWLIIPAILLQGYIVRVLRSAATDEGTPPAFDDWAEMLVDGLKLYVIGLAYLFIPYVLYFVALFALFGPEGGVFGLVFTLVALVLLLVAGYVLPVALTNFAAHDSIGAAFDFGTVFSTAFTGRYFVAFVLSVLAGIVLTIVSTILLVALLAGIFVLFYTYIVTYYLLARGCGPKLTDGVRPTEQAVAEQPNY